MKRLLAILFTVIFVTSLSACGTDKNMGGNGTDNNSMLESGKEIISDVISGTTDAASQTDAKLTADEALDIALKDAGVTKDNIRYLENHLEHEDGVLVYEIEFKSGNTEYSYDVNANTGVIVDRDKDLEN